MRATLMLQRPHPPGPVYRKPRVCEFVLRQVLGAPAPLLFALLLVAAGCERDVENTIQNQEVAAPGNEIPDEEQTAPEEQASVTDQIQAALTAARHDGKRVLLDFGADWCPDCRALDRMFAEDSVMAVLESGYHVVRIDVGRHDRNLDIVAQYGNPIAGGIPAIVILDGAGEALVATNQGELATARSMDSEQVLVFLRRWLPGRSDETEAG